MSRRKRGSGVSGARTKGARRATGERADGALLPGQRWTAGRKREVVLRMLRGESLDGLSRELGVEIYRLEQWRDKVSVLFIHPDGLGPVFPVDGSQ